MKHNLPHYGKKICVLIEDIDKEFCLRNLARWFEQTYDNYSLLLVGDKIFYTDISKISTRYGFETVLFDENHRDEKCLLCENLNTEDLDSEIIYMKVSRDASPLPYYLDILMMKMRTDKDSQELISQNILFPQQHVCNKKMSVFIPSMDRQQDVEKAFEALAKQTHSNYELVYIDYSSKEPLVHSLEKLCDKYQKTLSYNEPNSNSFVKCLRMENQEFFNISHAYNFAIKQVETDIVSILCADSVPWDYYLDACANLVDEDTLVQSHWGLHTITRSNWKKLNGHQEFIVGWGSEDDDFRIRAILMGLSVVVIPDKIVFQIPQTGCQKSANRKIHDLGESSLTNSTRFSQYIAARGHAANYGREIGNSDPIEYVAEGNPVNTKKIWCFKSGTLDKNNLPDGIHYDEEFKIFYKITDTDFDCSKYHSGVFCNFTIPFEYDNVKKILSRCEF